MADILDQFKKIFFEEGFELLDSMEGILLRFDHAAIEAEDLNILFRVAHSLKGNASTFNFQDIAAFTHELESGLEPVRQGQRILTRTGVDILLNAVDLLRTYMTCAQAGQPVPVEDSNREGVLTARFRAALSGAPEGASADRPAAVPLPSVPGALPGARISFKAPEDAFRRGLNLERLFRDVARLGPLALELDGSRIPPFETLDPETCHLAWNLELRGPVTRLAIEEAFEFVLEGDNLVIEPLAPPPPSSPPVTPEPEFRPPPDPAAHPASAGAETTPERRAPPRAEATTLRVNTEKIDQLLDLVGELVITQAMLTQSSLQMDPTHSFGRFHEALQQLDRQTRDLQERVMGIRMVPVDMVFSRFPRLVRDLCKQLDKEVDLHLEGTSTELDKSFIEMLVDPLTHLVRNGLDHGIESRAERLASGKPIQASLVLRAFSRGGYIYIEVQDDGKGLDRDRILAKAQERGLVAAGASLTKDEIHQLIFEPGFSTAAVVSGLSGRGVGMDVVRQNIRNLGGRVEVESEPGLGSKFRLIMPLTLAILDGLIVRLGEETYIFPLASVLESFRPKPGDIQSFKGAREVINLRGEYIPVLRLPELLETGTDAGNDRPLLVVVEAENRRAALVVDDLIGQSQVVIKSLETNFRRVEGLSGATILGDGKVALILDVPGLMRLAALAGAGV
jgi:two-component system chemotaxis sensor kinase CheA